MPFCDKCGAPVGFGKKYCPECGSAMDGSGRRKEQKTQREYQDPYEKEAPKTSFSEKINNLNQTPDSTGAYSTADIQANKGYAILSYLSILCLIPIFGAKDSPFARFHANQGLVLFLTEIIFSFIKGFLSWGYLSLFGLSALFNLVFFVLMMIGIANAANGKAKELPVIGRFKLLS